jgi:UDP-GlcNAc:undecaprenyl-phosphate GlcNAc-1-phosphate transferase
MPLVSPFYIAVVLFFIELLYFKIADHYNIIDHPNERSSHSVVTIRGGGIIFCLAAILFYFIFGFEYSFFIIGLVLIAAISFLDDILTLNSKIRLSIHLLAVLLLFLQWNLFELQWYWLIIAAVFVIATINAYNFMDGINGITGIYSLVTILTLYYINESLVSFTSSPFLIIVGISLLVFNFFNFRTKAKCFAGDVGSVSMAFILTFLIGQLILETNNLAYILLLFLYGLDTAVTVFFRVLRKENILQAHRSHLYQFLANERKWPHLLVSILYGILQILINLLLVFLIKDSTALVFVFVVFILVCFVFIRFLLEGKNKLLGIK